MGFIPPRPPDSNRNRRRDGPFPWFVVALGVVMVFSAISLLAINQCPALAQTFTDDMNNAGVQDPDGDGNPPMPFEEEPEGYAYIKFDHHTNTVVLEHSPDVVISEAARQLVEQMNLVMEQERSCCTRLEVLYNGMRDAYCVIEEDPPYAVKLVQKAVHDAQLQQFECYAK